MALIDRFALVSALAFTAAAGFAGCSPGGEPNESNGAPAPAGENGELGDVTIIDRPQAADLTIGDVEQQVVAKALLAPESRANNITENVQEDNRPRVHYVLVTVEPPRPEALYIDFTVTGERSFANTPVALTCDVVVDAEMPDGSTQRVRTEDVIQTVVAEQRPQNPWTYKANVMEGIQGEPASILVFLEMDARMMPLNTPPEEVDPATAETAGDREAIIESNPVRINFGDAEATP